MQKVVILDNGHGIDTPGKKSPDGLFLEWEWTRMFVKKLKAELELLGYLVFVIVPEDEDIKLSERTRRANNIIAQYGASNCVFISIHNNAAGNGDRWYNATGWEVYTTPGNNNSDKFATCLANACNYLGIKLRADFIDGDPDKESHFTVIYKTNCPAALTENMFMDSKKDVEFLQSDEGIEKLINIHLIGIQKYFGWPVSIISE